MTTLNTTQTPVKLYRMSTPDHDCPWGLKAIHLLKEQGIEYEDHPLRSKEEVEAFKQNMRSPPHHKFSLARNASGVIPI